MRATGWICGLSVASLFPVSLTWFSTLDVPSTTWWLAHPPAFFRRDCGFPTLSALLTDWPLEYSVWNCLTEVSYLQFSLTLKSDIYTLYTTLFPFEVKKWVNSVTLGGNKWTRTLCEKNLLAIKWESWLHWNHFFVPEAEIILLQSLSLSEARRAVRALRMDSEYMLSLLWPEYTLFHIMWRFHANVFPGLIHYLLCTVWVYCTVQLVLLRPGTLLL